jgi:hypothetical protein
MMKLTEKSRKILRAIYCGVGTVAVSLSLSMCPNSYFGMYGMPNMYGPGPDIPYDEVILRGRVICKETQETIRGIAIWINGQIHPYPSFTNFLGEFYFFAPKQENYTIRFTDIDGSENGGSFKQFILELTLDQAEALNNNPITIELEKEE